MRKQDNPYQPDTVLYRLMDEDWSGMTQEQIAAALGTTRRYIAVAIHEIWDRTGYIVEHVDGRKVKNL